jgi:hypothetical protein
MLIKLGEAVTINHENLHPLEKLASDDNLDIENRMYKFAQDLKVIAPQAKDFLYFTCIMMHAAEAACLNDDGTHKKTTYGEDIVGNWEKVGTESVKWVCNDSSVKPMKNSNGDIFPRSELKKAYKNWVGKPLCLDHKSNSVDHIRGVIVDTVYDDKHDRIIALCALDKKNYGDLSDKVRTGVAASVSMGVAVGRAVCTDCYVVARSERDFCQHMKGKNGYGEVNLDLNPIELSLVVAGADPRAKVKHIIASDIAKAAGLLTDYLQLKEASKEVSTQDLESIKKDLEDLSSKVKTLITSSESDVSDAVGPNRSEQTVENEVSTKLNEPEDFPIYASELQRAILGAQTKLASLQENLIRINKNEEPTMTRTKNAYYQGTEEPKPGQQQYAVDPLNDKAREMDKTLVGQPPFPNVGNVDGMYPGDEEVKKNLLRLADEMERSMFREAALKKAKEQLMAKGYFQGTEEPTPGKTQYKSDPLNEKDRMLDKQMVGAPPFPNVGKVDGLYNDDLKEKEKLSRASLRAKFEKASQPDGRIDKANSRWVVYANDKPILSATVNQITKKNADALYDAVATKKFGMSLLTRIQTEGFQATANALLKNAQEQPADPAAAAPPPVVAPTVPVAPVVDMPPVDDLTPPDEVGAEVGEPTEIIDNIADLAHEIEDNIDQLKKSQGPVEEDADKLEDVSLAGDEDFMPGVDGEVVPKTASQLQSMRKKVNVMLQDGITETITSLQKHAKELNVAKGIYSKTYTSMNKKQRDYLNTLTISAVKDAKAVLADTNKLKAAVVKYAYGTAELEKRASVRMKTAISLEEASVEELQEALEAKESQNNVEMIEFEDMPEMDNMLEIDDSCDMADAAGDMSVETSSGEKIPVKIEASKKGDLMSKLSTKEDRALARANLSQKGLGFNELSAQAHPGGGTDIELDITTTTPAEFLVYKELKDKMLGLANLPPKVRKQAEMINTLVIEGKLEPSKVDELVAHGVDSDAVKYWKSLWSEAKDPQANEFASKLTQEHANAKKAEDIENYKGQVKRAYNMAHQMVAKGFINESQIASQAEDILNWNDAGFNNFKKILDRQQVVKQASIPTVGLLDSGSIILPTTHTTEKQIINGGDLKSVFDNYFEQADRQKGVKF